MKTNESTLPKEECKLLHPVMISGVCRHCSQYIRQGEILQPTINVQGILQAIEEKSASFRNLEITLFLTKPPIIEWFPVLERLTSLAVHENGTDLTDDIARRGKALTEAERNFCQQMLAEDPQRLAARLLLLGYCVETKDERDWATHAAWLIDHYPALAACSAKFCAVQTEWECSGLVEAKWLAAADLHRKNLKVLRNAARCLMSSNPEESENLLRRGKRLATDPTSWTRNLAELYTRRFLQAQGAARGEYAARALQYYDLLEKQLIAKAEQAAASGNHGSGGASCSITTNKPAVIAMLAFETADLQRARKHAKYWIDAYGQQWRSYPEELHQCCTVLGRLALVDGELETAKRYLMESLQLDDASHVSYSLASDLHQRGENEAVLFFLQVVRHRDDSDKSRLDESIEAIREGRVVDFAAIQ